MATDESADPETEDPAGPGSPGGGRETLTVERVLSAPDGESVDIVEDRTLPEILFDHVDDRPEDVALRWKRYGIWQEFTWAEYYDRVEAFALGLEQLGFGDGDVLFTIGYNRPHQLWAWLAAQALGGMAAPNYEDMLPGDIRDQLQLLEPSIVYGEDQEMVDKLLLVAEEVPSLETIVYRDPKGMFRYENGTKDTKGVEVTAYEDVEAVGRERRETGDVDADYLPERVDRVDPDAPAMLAPTSGTTGMPKRVKLSHFNFLNLANAAIEIDPLPEESDYFSYLPMAWVGEQMILIAAAFVGGWTANFPEQPETEAADLREIGPEIIFSSPNRYEAWVADIKAKIENTTWLKRTVYERAMDVGRRYASYVSGEAAGDPPAWLRAAHWLLYWIAYRPILDKVGLKRAKNVYTGGGPLGEEHFSYYHALGVPLKQIWGQSEVCGFVTMHRDDDIQADTVGEVFPNVEVGITPGGELLVRGPVVTSGYFGMPAKTDEAMEDGWLHTDDFGAITDDGHVKIFDRMDDVLELADGTAIAPISVETKLKFNPYVKEAMVVGEGRESLTAVLNIRFDNVAEWADQRDIQYAGYRDLTQKPPVLELLREVVAESNADLEDPIERFVALFKEFDADDGELTRTGKLRREVVVDRYGELIEGLYDEEREEVDMELTITYQNGRQSTERGRMRVVDVAEPVQASLLRSREWVADARATASDGAAVAVVGIDGDAVTAHLGDHSFRTTDAADLAARPAVGELVRQAVEAANEDLERRVDRFLVVGGTVDDADVLLDGLLEGGQTVTVDGRSYDVRRTDDPLETEREVEP